MRVEIATGDGFSRTDQSHIGEPAIWRRQEGDLQFTAAGGVDDDGRSRLAQQGRDQRGSDGTGSASQCLGLDTALIGADAVAIGAAMLGKIDVHTAGKMRVMPQERTNASELNLFDRGGEDDEMRDAGIDGMAGPGFAIGAEGEIKLCGTRGCHCQTDQIAMQVGAHETGERAEGRRRLDQAKIMGALHDATRTIAAHLAVDAGGIGITHRKIDLGVAADQNQAVTTQSLAAIAEDARKIMALRHPVSRAIVDDDKVIATAMHARETQAGLRRCADFTAIWRQPVYSLPLFDRQGVTLHALSRLTKVKRQRVQAAIDPNHRIDQTGCKEMSAIDGGLSGQGGISALSLAIAGAALSGIPAGCADHLHLCLFFLVARRQWPGHAGFSVRQLGFGAWRDLRLAGLGWNLP